MNPYFVLYYFYTEYTQFEGSWDKDWINFSSFSDATDFIDSVKNNSDYRDVIGPFAKEYCA